MDTCDEDQDGKLTAEESRDLEGDGNAGDEGNAGEGIGESEIVAG